VAWPEHCPNCIDWIRSRRTRRRFAPPQVVKVHAVHGWRTMVLTSWSMLVPQFFFLLERGEECGGDRRRKQCLWNGTMSHRLTASPPSGTASRLPLALCHGSATAQTARLATGIASRRNRRWYNWIFCFSSGAADPRNHDSARTHASVQVLFWSSIVDRSEGRLAATQSEERLMLPCRLACWRWLHWPRAWCTALVSSLD